MPREIEAKFPLFDRKVITEKLLNAGAERLYPETFEDNIILDRRGELKTRGALLRIRKFGRYVLVTSKGPVAFTGGVKSRDEVQTGIESFESAIALFEMLGYKPVFRYQKMREVWRLDQAEIVLDHTPIGDYLEIEAQTDVIEKMAEILGLRMEDAIRMSYAELYRQQRRVRSDLTENMVFSPEELPSP